MSSRGGSGWLRRSRSVQQARRAEIFVDFRPMEAEARAADAPVLALGFRGVEEPRVPDEGDDDGSTVEQVYGEGVGCEVNVLDSFPGFKGQASVGRSALNQAAIRSANWWAITAVAARSNSSR